MKRILIALLFLLVCLPHAPAHAAEPEVLVLLWFDTEDYLLRASDDAAKRVAEILTARGIRGTFKVVGEVARVLEKRGRSDVIAALRRHDIGYHTNLHSVHPTPAEYLADSGWLDGVEEFVRHERTGAADVRRVFGVKTLSCYGQPGSSWAPQAMAALPRLDIVTPSVVSAYVDDGSHVGVDDRPFWYCGVLNVFNMGRNSTRMELHEPGGLEKGCADFKAIYDRLRAEGGGLISIYYHPNEWVHKEFWDAVNFSKGANPPREAWKAPGQLLAEATEAAFTRFEKYLDFQRSLPGVRFVTASELPAIYRNRIQQEGAERGIVADVAKRVAGSSALDVIRDSEGRLLSPADQFWLVTAFLAQAIQQKAAPDRVSMMSLLGPSEQPPAAAALDLPWPAFRDALLDAADDARVRGQVPSRVFAGTKPIAPADFLRAAAGVVGSMAGDAGGPPAFPERVSIPAGTTVATERYVADDTPELYGGWIIHPEGFRAPGLVKLAKLQAWTIKPAVR